MHSASMKNMATLYVRNVPEKLYAQLIRWAEESGRSVNNEVLALLDREAIRRGRHADWWGQVEAVLREVKLAPGARDSVEIIREDRDTNHGHQY